MKVKNFYITNNLYYDYNHRDLFCSEPFKKFNLKSAECDVLEMFMNRFNPARRSTVDIPLKEISELLARGENTLKNDISYINKHVRPYLVKENRDNDEEKDLIINRGLGYALECSLGFPLYSTPFNIDCTPLHRQSSITGIYFEKNEIFFNMIAGNELYLALPNAKSLITDEQQTLIETLHSHPDLTFSSEDKGFDFITLCQINKIDDIAFFEEILKKNRLNTALSFLEKTEGNLRNEKIVGVVSTRYSNKKLQYELFETDYFTHKVIENTLFQIFDQKPPYEINGGSLNGKKLWRTSLGLSIIVEVPFDNGEKVVITKRKGSASYSTQSGIEPYYVSATETVMFSDIVNNNPVNIEGMVYRALKEELSISKDYVSEIKITSAFYTDVFVSLKTVH